MGRFVTLTTQDGTTLRTYRSDPVGTPRGGVVVLQEIFGVNHQIRSAADRFAALGYLAIAPAVQDRMMPGFETDDYSPEAFGKARQFIGGFSQFTGSSTEIGTISTLSLFGSTLGAIVGGTLTAPFTAAVTALLYIDRRMRIEGLDLELARAATAPQSPPPPAP